MGNQEPLLGVRKWVWMRAASGGLIEINLDWLDGELSEMAAEFGGFSAAPVLEKTLDGNVEISIYSLDRKRISESDKSDLEEAVNSAAYRETGEHDDLDSWINDGDKRGWYYFFKPVHPSSHVIFVHYGSVFGYVEAYGIFCETYADMLNVLGKINTAHG